MLQTAHCPFTNPPPHSQSLLPVFQDWTYATLSSLPSVSQVGDHVPVAQCLPTLVPQSPFSRHRQRLHQCRHRQQSGPQLIHLDGPQLLLTGVRGVRNSLPSCVASRFSCKRCRLKFIAWQPRLPRFVPVVPVPLALPPMVRPPMHPSPLHVLLLAIPELLSQAPLVVSRQRQLLLLPRTAHQPPFQTASRVCVAVAPHKFPSFVPPVIVTPRSRRCLHHCSDRRFAQPVETRTSSSQLPPSTTPPRLRVCRAVGCHSSTHSRCRVGFCSNHCRSSRCRASRQPSPTQPTCRRPHCSELVQPGCPVGYCNLHCTSPRCPLHDPLSLSENGQGAARC